MTKEQEKKEPEKIKVNRQTFRAFQRQGKKKGKPTRFHLGREMVRNIMADRFLKAPLPTPEIPEAKEK